MNYNRRIFNTRLGFFILAVILFWIKSYLAYQIEFSLGVEGMLQQFLLLLNPLPLSIVLLSAALYFRKPKKSYAFLLVLYFLLTLLLYANILYYREFTDFLTAGTVLGVKNNSG